MSEWKLAMLALTPLMAKRPMMRTWFALMGASLAAMIFAPMSVKAYILIDGIAGLLVITRPAGLAQKTIGALFALMVLFHIGYLWGAHPGSSLTYWQANVSVGWAQWGCLLAWGLWDAGKVALDRIWPLGGSPFSSGAVR